MRKWMIPVMMLLSMVTLEASRTGCKTIEQGPFGPAGSTGSTGPGGHMGASGSTGAAGAISNQHFYIDTNGNTQIVPFGDPVIFFGSPISAGTAFSFSSPSDTIYITQSGDYFLNFVGYAESGTRLTDQWLQVTVNNILVGQPAYAQLGVNSDQQNGPFALPLTLIIHVTGASLITPVPVQVFNVANATMNPIEVTVAMIDLVQLSTF